MDCIATFDDSLGEIENGAIFVEANVIKWVGKTEELPTEYSQADCELDLANRVIIPGMVIHLASFPFFSSQVDRICN